MKNETRNIPLAEIHSALINTHLPTGRDEDFSALVASMRATGLIQHIVVRRFGEQYETIDGHRRIAAARELGWETIPAVITDDDAATARVKMLTANVLRLENDPIAEAELINEMRSGGMTFADVAAAIGKSESYIARRARLAQLTPKWRSFARLNKISIGVIERIAAYNEEFQTAVWDEDCRRHGSDDFKFNDEDDILYAFDIQLKRLDSVPFSTNGCKTCQHNTANIGYLFADIEDEAQRCASCQNRECFVRKWNEAIKKKTDQLKKDTTIKLVIVKQRWDVPEYYLATEKRNKDTAEAYVTQEELPVIYYLPKRNKPAKVKKDPEEAARDKVVRIWRGHRSAAFKKIDKVLEASADEVFSAIRKAPGYDAFAENAVRGRIKQTWNDDYKLEVYQLLGAEGLAAAGCEQLNSEEIAALNTPDPTTTEEATND